MGHAPENTLKSIRTALQLGSPFIEIDVHLVDGHLMVIHDDRLERTTNGTGLVMEHSFETLRTLDAGEGECIPTLQEVCDLTRDKAGLNIELKGSGTASPVADFIASQVEAGWDKRAFLVSSYHHQELLDMRERDSSVQLGIIARMIMPGALDLAASIDAFSIHPQHGFINPLLVEHAHARNLKVYPYTVNEPEEIARMAELGVDGLFTNYPERITKTYSQGTENGIW